MKQISILWRWLSGKTWELERWKEDRLIFEYILIWPNFLQFFYNQFLYYDFANHIFWILHNTFWISFKIILYLILHLFFIFCFYNYTFVFCDESRILNEKNYTMNNLKSDLQLYIYSYILFYNFKSPVLLEDSNQLIVQKLKWITGNRNFINY